LSAGSHQRYRGQGVFQCTDGTDPASVGEAELWLISDFLR
jgi:hypothetical protein